MTGPTRTPAEATRELRTRLVHGELTLEERLAVTGVLDTALATVDVYRNRERITGIDVLAESVEQLAAFCAASTPASEATSS